MHDVTHLRGPSRGSSKSLRNRQPSLAACSSTHSIHTMEAKATSPLLLGVLVRTYVKEEAALLVAKLKCRPREHRLTRFVLLVYVHVPIHRVMNANRGQALGNSVVVVVRIYIVFAY
jgi:hypothetical protein